MKQESFNKQARNPDLYLQYCGTEICSPDFIMPPHVRQEYLFHYVLSGHGTFFVGHTEHALSPGSLFLIRPGELVSYAADPKDPLHFSWFAFSGSFSEQILENTGFFKGIHVRHLHSRFSIHDRIMDFLPMLETRVPCSEYRLLGNLVSIFGNMQESYESDIIPMAKTAGERTESHVMRAVTYIRLNYMQPISVRDVTSFVGLERSYLSKIFHLHTGDTIQGYLMKTRIRQAKYLLDGTDHTVREISSFVGFQDEYYFSRAFKKIEGISPQTYRMEK